MKKLIPFLLIIALFSIAVEANPHPITYEKGRSLDINDYDIDSIKYNGPFWNPDLNVLAFKVGGEGRLVRSKQGIDPIYYYPSSPIYYGHYPMYSYIGYDYPYYGYQKYYGYNIQRYNSFNNCPTTTFNQGFYSDTYIDCGRRYYPYNY